MMMYLQLLIRWLCFTPSREYHQTFDRCYYRCNANLSWYTPYSLMPNKITNRKRHVGNDIVHIIYGIESELLDVDHERLAISGHFGFVTIYVIPFVCIDMVKISINLKKGLDPLICSALSHLVGSRVVSRKISAETVRALAVEADLICLSMIEEKLGLVLNIEERQIKLNEMSRHLAK